MKLEKLPDGRGSVFGWNVVRVVDRYGLMHGFGFDLSLSGLGPRDEAKPLYSNRRRYFVPRRLKNSSWDQFSPFLWMTEYFLKVGRSATQIRYLNLNADAPIRAKARIELTGTWFTQYTGDIGYTFLHRFTLLFLT